MGLIDDFVSMKQEIGLDDSRGFSIPNSRICNDLVKIQEFGIAQDLGSSEGG